MSILNLVTKKGNFIGPVEIDAVLSESAKTDSRITSNPVEKGADFNDHIIIVPMEFNVTGVVSNASTSALGQFGAAAGTVASAFGAQTKAQRKWEDLLKLQADQVPFPYVQGLATYDNVVIKSLQVVQTADTSNELLFSAVLREIIEKGSVELPAATYDSQDVSDKASVTTNSGVKTVGGL